MRSKWLEAFRAAKHLKETVELLEEAVGDLEARMDRDEAKRSEWVGTVKRTLARINRSEQRGEVEEPEPDQRETYGQLVNRAFRRS